MFIVHKVQSNTQVEKCLYLQVSGYNCLVAKVFKCYLLLFSNTL